MLWDMNTIYAFQWEKGSYEISFKIVNVKYQCVIFLSFTSIYIVIMT